ncbi:MAG: hypothetical protein ACRDIB_07315 [Ardenticatenaceae bacterium]
MATARWFFGREPESLFVIQEHLRQGYWRVGPSAMWIDAVQATIPYRAVGYWHDVAFELEWVPLEYVLLRSSRPEKELVRATTLLLGFKPVREAEEDGKHVVEWRPRKPVEAPPPPLAATPAVEPNGRVGN